MEFRDLLILAPMAGITTPAHRVLVEEAGGCDLYFTEMINAASFVDQGPYERYYVIPDPVPGKLVYQLVGGREDSLAKAAEMLDELPGMGVDVNMGCCAPEILHAGGGITWMKDAERAKRLVALLRSRLKAKTLSVKLRIGFEEDGEYLLRFCRGLEEAGADFITLHPRLKKEKFGRFARWEYVAELERNLRIPVFGNGDVRTFEDYVYKTGRFPSNGVMIGRSAARAPWFFAYLRGRIADREFELEADLESSAFRFLELLPRYQPEDFLESRAKRFFFYFCDNLFFGHHLKTGIQRAESFEEIEKLVAAYFRDHPEERFRTEG